MMYISVLMKVVTIAVQCIIIRLSSHSSQKLHTLIVSYLFSFYFSMVEFFISDVGNYAELDRPSKIFE